MCEARPLPDEGGSSRDIENLQVLCVTCSSRKGARALAVAQLDSGASLAESPGTDASANAAEFAEIAGGANGPTGALSQS